MKKTISFILVLGCLVVMVACNSKTLPQKRWYCAVTCCEESSDNAYVISYYDERIISSTGSLTIDNENDFDIVVHLTADGKEIVNEIKAGGVLILYQVAMDTAYTLGCHADVAEGTEIVIVVYDGEGNIPGTE